MPALIIGANIPDIDVVTVLLGDMQHLAWRRGITHGPVAWVVLPLALAAALWWFDRWQQGRGKAPGSRPPTSLPRLYALAFIACLTHPALDWLNVYGVRLLEPFSQRWFYGDTLFIIDVWLWLGMGLATWLSLRRERRGGEWRRPARLALAAALAYIGVNAAITWRDETVSGLSAPSAIANPVPLIAWSRAMVLGEHNDWYVRAQNGRLQPVTEARCAWPDTDALRQSRADLDAFLFWGRALFATRAPDGSVLIRDARFHDPLISDRFTIPLPELRCEQPAGA